MKENKKKEIIDIIRSSFSSIESRLWFLYQKFPNNNFYKNLRTVKKLSKKQISCINKDFKREYKKTKIINSKYTKKNLFFLHKETDDIENIQLFRKK